MMMTEMMTEVEVQEYGDSDRGAEILTSEAETT